MLIFYSLNSLHQWLMMRVLSPVLDEVQRVKREIMASLDALTAEVAELKTTTESTAAIIDGLQEKVANLAPNQAAIDALAADIKASREKLVEAAKENTPASEEPPFDASANNEPGN